MIETPVGNPAAPRSWGAPRRREITWYQPAGLNDAAQSGRAFLEAIRDGGIAPPPMGAVFGFRILEVDHGRMSFRARPRSPPTTHLASSTAGSSARSLTP